MRRISVDRTAPPFGGAARRAQVPAIAAVVFAAACGGPSKPPTPTPAPVATPPALEVVALPGGPAAGLALDYLLYDPRTKAVWVPAAGTGAVFVLDTATRALRRIDGFVTKEVERHGQKRLVGPSSAALGDGVVYIGSRGDQSVCAFDERTLAKGACRVLDGSPDALLYVAATRELWVTTPRDQSIRVLDGATLADKAKLSFEGAPEGFAVDNARGRVYTNLEDKDVTLAIEVATRATRATWKSGCGEDGPHGLRVAEPEGFLFVACSASVETLDAPHDGAVLGTAKTGDGVDDLDYSAARHQLYVGGAKDGTLAVVSVAASGALAPSATIPAHPGARNGVVDAEGRVYLASGKESALVVITTKP